MKRYRIQEVVEILGTREEELLRFIEERWIVPAQSPGEFDEQDLARARLILELRDELDVNEEAIEIILKLLDQLVGLRCELKRRSRAA